MDLIFATNNKNKIKEVSNQVSNDYSIQGLSDFGVNIDIPETGNTLKENALIKARYIYQNYNVNVFADDTGLEVDALNGAPGVYSARYAGEDGDSEKNMQKLLVEMDGLENRKARFRTVIALIIDGKEYLFEGVAEGEILTKKNGVEGFGYDPIFKPEGFEESFAQMSIDQKNKISHRGKAVMKLVEFLNSI